MIAVEEEDLSNITKAEQDLHGRLATLHPDLRPGLAKR